MKELPVKGFKAIFLRSVLQIVRRPLYWVGFFMLPLFFFLFLSSLMEQGLPTRVPAAIVDKDGTPLSREITQNLGGMQMVDLKESCHSFTQARHSMQEGNIFGFFLIPENFQADLMAGRKPVITFYTHMTYYVPASLLFKTFKTTATYAKAGVAMSVLNAVGGEADPALLLPVNIVSRPLGNPWLDYAIYLCNSFIPCVLQLMIFLITCFSLGQEIKYGTSRRLLQMADGSIFKALAAKLLPQTLIWIGVLSFSLAAFSFPIESMYPAMGIFSWILPTRYNFLIYIDQALNGIPVYYSRVWYVAYIIFMLLPFTMMWNIRRCMKKPVYVP